MPLTLGGAGSDTLLGEVGDDVLTGGEGADRLDGDHGNDVLAGEAGDDALAGGTGDDMLEGGTGADTLTGNDGSDTYHFSAGDGEDTIDERGMVAANLEDSAGIDVIRFGNEINYLDTSFQRYGNGDLTIRYGEGDAITIKGQYSTLGNAIERVELGDEMPGAGTDVISPCKVFPDLQADVMGLDYNRSLTGSKRGRYAISQA